MTPYFEKNTESTEPIDDSNYATTSNGAGVTEKQRKAEIVEMKRDKTEEYKKELEETKQDLQDLNYQTCSEIKTQAYSGGYNENFAREYAKRWALSFNKNEYRTEGNDCANFVSQALRAGGIKFVGNDVGSTDHWFYKPGPTANTAQSWKGAKAIFQHFSKNTRNSRQRHVVSMREKHKIKDFVNDIGWGDVVHFDWEGNGGVGHTMIVTDFEWNHEYQKYMPLLSGHTDPYLNRRLTDTGYWNHAPSAKIYFNRPSND